MNQTIRERILMFEPLYAATLPPPPPRLVRQHADRSDSMETVSDYNTDDEMDETIDMDSDSD
jgi:hypothetical protein